MFDYETLKLAWWVLIGVLLIGFALFDGIDMGAAILLPFAGRTDAERRVIINTVGPHWEGNQVWLVTAGGAIFAAWPMVYAAAFSGFYWAMLLVLFALFLRPVGFDYRSKLADPRWRNAWDWGLFVGGAVPSLVFGVAFGNLLLGVPFHLDQDLRSFYTGTFWALLNPFGILAGLVSVCMIAAQGGAWLGLRSSDRVVERSRRFTQWFSGLHLVLFALAGVWLVSGIQGFSIVGAMDVGQTLNPLAKSVVQDNAGWQANFHAWPLLWLAPALGMAGSVLCLLMTRWQRDAAALFGSSLAIVGTVATAGIALFPFVMPSSTVPDASLTLWDAASSQMTLGIMLVTAAIFVPLILAYTLWGYYKLWGRISTAHIEKNTHTAY